MRQKVWTASDLEIGSESVAGGESVVPAVAGGESIVEPAPAIGREVPLNAATAGGEGVIVSDIRLKDDIVRVGRTSHGLPLYRFRYKGGSQRLAGVMAQDVLGVMPEAVSVGADGFYRVNYGMLGIALRRA